MGVNLFGLEFLDLVFDDLELGVDPARQTVDIRHGWTSSHLATAIPSVVKTAAHRACRTKSGNHWGMGCFRKLSLAGRVQNRSRLHHLRLSYAPAARVQVKHSKDASDCRSIPRSSARSTAG